MKELSENTLKGLAADYFGVRSDQIQATPRLLNKEVAHSADDLVSCKELPNHRGLLFDTLLPAVPGTLYYPLNLVHKDINCATTYRVSLAGKHLGSMDANANHGAKASDIHSALFEQVEMKYSMGVKLGSVFGGYRDIVFPGAYYIGRISVGAEFTAFVTGRRCSLLSDPFIVSSDFSFVAPSDGFIVFEYFKYGSMTTLVGTFVESLFSYPFYKTLDSSFKPSFFLNPFVHDQFRDFYLCGLSALARWLPGGFGFPCRESIAWCWRPFPALGEGVSVPCAVGRATIMGRLVNPGSSVSYPFGWSSSDRVYTCSVGGSVISSDSWQSFLISCSHRLNNDAPLDPVFDDDRLLPFTSALYWDRLSVVSRDSSVLTQLQYMELKRI